nr:EthD domain-containing protein [Novosphingobium profundi]
MAGERAPGPFATRLEPDGSRKTPVYRSFAFHQARADLGHAGYLAYWRTRHAPMARRVHGLGGYAINEIVEPFALAPYLAAKRAAWPALDGIAVLRVSARDGLETMARDQPAVRAWYADGPNFIGHRTARTGREIIFQPPAERRAARPPLKGMIFCDLVRDEVAQSLAMRTGLAGEGLVVTAIEGGAGPSSLDLPDFSHVVEIWGSSLRAVCQRLAGFAAAIAPAGRTDAAMCLRETVIA